MVAERSLAKRSDNDVRLILTSQAVRAFGYGLASVLVASNLADRGLSAFEAGLILGAVVTGTVLAQLAVARWSDQWGRRRSYLTLYLALGLSGVVFAAPTPLWLLVAAALFGALSTEVVESGPFTSLELAMLAGRLDRDALATGFGWYNAIAATAGAAGAAAAGLPQLARRAWEGAPPDQAWLVVLVPVALIGASTARRLSPQVEPAQSRERATPLGASRPAVLRLSGLFAVDAFAGGFVVQTFIAFWLLDRHGATTANVAVLFAAIGVVQTLSFLAAPLLARRIGLLNTMVFTHLPANLLLAALAFAPNLETAAALLLVRAALSQMDVPTRQAYVIALVQPAERTGAIAYTNTVRYLARPIGPIAAGALLTLAAGAPFLVAGAIKSLYDLTLWRWFRKVPLT
jgi:MFS family permease